MCVGWLQPQVTFVGPVNNATVVTGDLHACNWIVHVVNRVLLPNATLENIPAYDEGNTPTPGKASRPCWVEPRSKVATSWPAEAEFIPPGWIDDLINSLSEQVLARLPPRESEPGLLLSLELWPLLSSCKPSSLADCNKEQRPQSSGWFLRCWESPGLSHLHRRGDCRNCIPLNSDRYENGRYIFQNPPGVVWKLKRFVGGIVQMWFFRRPLSQGCWCNCATVFGTTVKDECFIKNKNKSKTLCIHDECSFGKFCNPTFFALGSY